MLISSLFWSNVVKFTQTSTRSVFVTPSIVHSSFRSSLRWFGMCSASKDVSTTSSLVQIPPDVRGMKELDKTKFQTSVSFPVMEVEPKEVGRLRGCLAKFTIKQFGKTLKPIMDSEDKKTKFVVFHPDIVNTQEVRDEILSVVSSVTGDSTKSITEREYPLGFEEWDLRAIFKAVLPEGIEFSSFTQTGHLVHCNLQDELIPYGRVIGQIILEKNVTCRTVVNKPDMISNQFRTFEVDLLAGDADYVVETIEDGVRFKMDFTKVFWNSRLSHEHARVIKNLSASSLVFDACAGIGPFVIPAARRQQAPRVCYANDLNPESVRWLKENMKINGLKESSITVFNDDASAFVRGPVAMCLRKHASLPPSERPEAAHVIMNLPALAVTFLPAFRGMLNTSEESGSSDANTVMDTVPEDTVDPFPVIVYCYLFAKAHEDVPNTWYEEKAREMANEQLGWSGVEIRKTHRVRTVSNRKVMFCVECVLPWALLRSREEKKNGGSTVDDENDEPSRKKMKESE